MSFPVLALELNKTAAVFRAELSTVAIETYWESLSGYSDEDLKWACKRARETCDFMPTIRDLLGLLRPRLQQKASHEDADVLLKKLEAFRPEPWPERKGRRRRGHAEPTPVAELVAPYIGPTDEKH